MAGEPPELQDHLMATGFVSMVFMTQMIVELARTQPDPLAWAQQFVARLHERIDANEERMDDRRYPVHELARSQVDSLGRDLTRILQPR